MQHDVVDDLFDAYLDLTLRGRAPSPAEFLASRSPIDSESRGRFLAFAAELDLRATSAVAHDRPSTPPIPATFGPYRILELLGSGGQGVVYLAEDSRLSRRVALKVLRFVDAAIDPAASPLVARLRREAELTSRLDHPGICTVFELGTIEHVHFIAMRFIDGITLARWIAGIRESADVASRTRLRDPRASRDAVLDIVAYVEKAARALHAAHEAGVIHRDVKPGNLLITSDADPVLLDFGLARDTTGDSPRLTATGQVHGTPAYMSPEQLESTHGPIDRRTDVYSLAVTMYEALTLRHPFTAGARRELERRIVAGAAPAARRLNPSIPVDVSTVLARAMDVQRELRYSTALDFADDLRRARLGEPTMARPAGVTTIAVRLARRHRVATAAAFLTIAAAVTGSMEMRRRARLDDARARFAEGKDAVATDPARALELALEAASWADPAEVAKTIDQALNNFHELRRIKTDSGVQWSAAVPASENREEIIVGALVDGSLLAWNRRDEVVFEEGTDGTALVSHSALSPDHALLAWTTRSGSLEVRNTEDWSPRLSVPIPGAEHVAFDAEAKVVLVTTIAQELLFIDTDSGGSLGKWSINLRPSGLAAGRFGGPVIVTAGHPAAGTRCLRDGIITDTYEAPSATQQPCALSPDGEWFVARTSDGARLVSTRSSATYKILTETVDAGDLALFDHAGGRVLISGLQGGFRLFSVLEGTMVGTESIASREAISSAAFSPDDGLVAAGGRNGGLWLCDLNLAPTITLVGHHGEVTSCAFLDEQRLLTSSADGTIRLWSVDPLHTRRKVMFPEGVWHAQIDPQRKRVVISYGQQPSHIAWVSITDFRTIGNAEFGGYDSRRAIFSPDGRWIAVAHRDLQQRHGIMLLDTTLSAGRARAEYRVIAHPAAVWDVDFSRDGKFLVSAAEDGIARVFRTDEVLGDGAPQVLDAAQLDPRELRGDDHGLVTARFSRDGELVVTSSNDGGVRVFSLGKERRILHLRDTGKDPCDACFDTTGTRIAVAAEDDHVRVYDASDGAMLFTIDCGRGTTTHCVEFSDDGRWLAVGVGASVRLHDARTGARIRELEPRNKEVRSIEFVPDAEGDLIVWTAFSGEVRIWRADNVVEAQQALENRGR